ncbi:MAG TPA: DUF4199 domain-containing protein [Chitinophagaceae bacterium]|nr:DUF4199 domain-containing protein [Chitinophagaceae bacterium]
MVKNKNVSAGLTWGVILGLIYCLFLYLRWSAATNIAAYALLAVINYLLILGLLFVEAAYRKKSAGGFIELKELFQTLFISVLLFELFYALFDFLYLKWIDPGVIDRMRKATQVMFDKSTVPISDEQKKSTLQAIDSLRQSTQVGNVIQSYFTYVAVSGVLAFFIALIMRKRKPADTETSK